MREFKLFFLCFGLIVSLASCQGDVEVVEEPIIEQVLPFDTLAYLERQNSIDVIYKRTESYLEIINGEGLIENEMITNSDYLEGCMKSGFDSTSYY